MGGTVTLWYIDNSPTVMSAAQYLLLAVLVAVILGKLGLRNLIGTGTRFSYRITEEGAFSSLCIWGLV